MSVFLAFGVYAFLGKMSESLSQAAALGIGIAVGAVVFIVVEAVFIRKSTQVIPFVYAGVAGAMTNTLLVWAQSSYFTRMLMQMQSVWQETRCWALSPASSVLTESLRQ